MKKTGYIKNYGIQGVSYRKSYVGIIIKKWYPFTKKTSKPLNCRQKVISVQKQLQ